MKCDYCGTYDNFNIDEDGREFCFECGHYTGYREEADDYGYHWVDENNCEVERDEEPWE